VIVSALAIELANKRFFVTKYDNSKVSMLPVTRQLIAFATDL